jgi:gliding motility-associated-like protein
MIVFAQPANNDCGGAISIPSGKSFCSGDAQYTTVNATPSYTGSGSDVWFTFTPRDAYDIYITVYGAGNGGSGTLQAPQIKFFTNCVGPGGTYNQLGGSPVTSNNVTTLYEGGLKIGQLYYISVIGSNTGTFKLCIQNPTNAVKPGQEGTTAKRICSTETVREYNVTGAGSNPNEAAGTCMDNHDGQNTETNSAWFKWTAANNGTLVFTITPTVTTDDLDWVLFDLGTTDNSANINAAHAIRCADGNGVDNKKYCPSETVYYKTGLDFSSTDFNEIIGCGQGQDGVVRYVDMQQGHIYALMVNNPYSQGNGFTIDFTDRFGKAGTGTFAGPQAVMYFQQNQPCTVNQNYTFNSLSTNASTLKWDFGDGASIPTATTPGPFTISYSTPGTKTVVLEATGVNGCYTLDVKTFEVGQKPAKPAIQSNKPQFCLKDTIILSTPPMPNTSYSWTGPNNFKSDQASISIPVNSTNLAGTYTLIAIQGNCNSDPATITIPPILNNPVAAFTTVPALPVKLSLPVTVRFFNQSTNADSYLWDFDDGSTSTDVSPEHTYTAIGEYDVTLTAFKTNVCDNSVTKGTFVINADNTLFIPNTFTPNGDNINDEFVVNISNLQSYRIDIFNRWGQPLFAATSIFDNWTGIFNGSPLPVGTYYYVIDAIGLNGTRIKKSGYITLLR